MLSGKAFIVKGPKDYYRIKNSVILVAHTTHPDITLVTKKVIAIVTEVNNKLSHAAIIAREYRIPLIMGIENATRDFRTGDKLTIDMARKTVWKIH